MNVGEWWELQDPGRKRLIAIVGFLAAVFLVLWLIPGKQTERRVEPVSDVEVDILGDDRGAGDMQQLAAEVKVLKDEREQTQRALQQQGRRIQQLQNSLSAATNIAENPEQLGAMIDELNRLKEDFEELREKGVRPGTGEAPVQLVLGGEQGGGTTDPLAAGSADMSSPFSNVPDGSTEPIVGWDPLDRVKGAIDAGVTGGGGSQSQQFDFESDNNFDRPPPKIVIEEPDAAQPAETRTGGSRPGQTSRDQRGERLDYEETPEIYVPSGTLVEGILLNGMDAPTSSNSAREPYPVTIRLTSLAFLPNRYTTNVRECFVGAAGFGRLDSERVHLRTETMSCVLADGGIIDVPLEGYITGEDGKVGLRGVVVERTGQLLMRAALAGLGSGLAMALEPRQVQSIRTGDEAGGIQFDRPETSEVLEIGAYAGAATAMEKLADYYLERADQIFPIIEIDAMRRVTIHMTAGVSLKTVSGSKFGTLVKNESTR